MSVRYGTYVIKVKGKWKLFRHDKEIETINFKTMRLDTGCKGCNRYWYGCEPADCPPEQANKDGQCSRCSRCLNCCGDVTVEYSCAWKSARKTPLQRQRSAEAYDRWMNNPSILGHNRRIT